jgi:hypothetical protein
MLADEKQALEQDRSSVQKMFTERDTSSSEVMALAVAHTVGLLKSYVPDLDLELLHKEYQCETDAERDVLVDGTFDASQHFMFSYDFSMICDHSSPGNQS